MSKRTAADWFIYTSAVVFTAAGIFFVFLLPFTGTELAQYQRASGRNCDVSQTLTDTGCAANPAATVLDKGYANAGLDHTAPTVTVQWEGSPSELRLFVSRPTAAYYRLFPGENVTLTVWSGRFTSVHVGKSALRLYGNPYDGDDLRATGGISLLGLGLVLGAVHPPQWLRRRSFGGAGETQRRWRLGNGIAANITHDSRLRIALIAFVVAQLLDVVTSIKGGRVGLFEQNPLAATMIQRVGATITFLLLKAVAVIAIVLVMARLPRRAALIMAWATSIVFLYVAIHNVGLILSKRPA